MRQDSRIDSPRSNLRESAGGVPLAALPGGTLVQKGLADIAAGRVSTESLLVRIGAPRLRNLGFDVPQDGPLDPELLLYERLAESNTDSAHSRYNAMIGLLVSFERAVESGA